MFNELRSYVRDWFRVDTTPLSTAERWRSTVGALLSMGLCGWLLQAMPIDAHWLIAPVGASAVILFAMPHTPLGQPWPVLGSYLMATVAALTSSYMIPVPQLAAAVAVATSILLMARLNCLHPPGGAVALFLVLDGPYTIQRMGLTAGLVALNVFVLLASAVLINNMLLGRRYPYRPKPDAKNLHRTSDALPMNRMSLNHEDLESAVRSLDTFVDIQENELLELYNLAVNHAFGRHIGLTCGDIMSRDVVKVNFDTELEASWNLLRAHKIKALPIVDNFNRLIGILTVADFLRQIDDTTAAGLAVRLQGLLRRTPGTTANKAEVAGQIMTSNVHTARLKTPITDLVQQLSNKNLHHIPVIDEKRQVLGIVTQSDIIAALYKHIALSTVQRT
ncbi:MAG: HPP family protein [Burkholderiaceae bacterium]|nr:HPP family protein [Burkholderiaceae bacterium]